MPPKLLSFQPSGKNFVRQLEELKDAQLFTTSNQRSTNAQNQLPNLEKTERVSKLCPNQAENLPEPSLYNAREGCLHFFGADISDVNDHIVFEWLESFGYFGGAK